MEQLRKHSLDTYYTPIFMKKNRPSYKLSVLAYSENEDEILDIIFRHTTSIGIRKYPVDRVILDREIVNFDSSLGKARLKVIKYKDERFAYPEYEDIKGIASQKNMSIGEVYTIIKSEYQIKYI